MPLYTKHRNIFDNMKQRGYTPFFISDTFISNATLKLTENQAKAKQYPEAELLLFENYSISSSIFSSKNNRRYSKIRTKHKCVCFNEISWPMTMEMRLKMKNTSHGCDINRPRPRHRHKYTKYKMYLSNT